MRQPHKSPTRTHSGTAQLSAPSAAVMRLYQANGRVSGFLDATRRVFGQTDVPSVSPRGTAFHGVNKCAVAIEHPRRRHVRLSMSALNLQCAAPVSRPATRIQRMVALW
jgi:hypothetical protein